MFSKNSYRKYISSLCSLVSDSISANALDINTLLNLGMSQRSLRFTNASMSASFKFCTVIITGRFKCIKKKQGLNRGIETSLSVGQKEIKSKCFYLLRFKT